jgi:hypothetical protein
VPAKPIIAEGFQTLERFFRMASHDGSQYDGNVIIATGSVRCIDQFFSFAVDMDIGAQDILNLIV